MIYDIKQSGLRIRQLRLKSGFTQEKIAEALGVDRSFYSRIESGKRAVRLTCSSSSLNCTMCRWIISSWADMAALHRISMTINS